MLLFVCSVLGLVFVGFWDLYTEYLTHTLDVGFGI